LTEIFIQRTGKTPEQLQREISDIIQKYAKEGVVMHKQSEDWERIRMLEKREKPRAYAHCFKGLDKDLRAYREGVRVFDWDSSMDVLVSPPHYRTWGGPGFIDLGGQVHKEPMDREKFEAHWKATGRFSKIVWVNDWEAFKKIP
jgi:hypothetical protein